MVYSAENKVFLITGGAYGLGAAMARAFILEKPKYIAIVDIAEKAGLALEKELNDKFGANKVKFIKCDVTDEEQFSNAFKTVVNDNGYIDVVINNAGILNDSPAAYKKCVEINVTALINGSLKGLELMRKDRGGKGGTILNVASRAALVNMPQMVVYNATKSAVLQFTICLGSDPHYTRTGVRVLAVCCGATDTNILNTNKVNAIDEESTQDMVQMIESIVLQKPESAARAMVEAYKRGASASTWLSVNDNEVLDVTQNVRDGYAIMGKSAGLKLKGSQ